MRKKDIRVKGRGWEKVKAKRRPEKEKNERRGGECRRGGLDGQEHRGGKGEE